MGAGIYSTIREGMLQMPGNGARQLEAKVKPTLPPTAKNLIDRVGHR